MNTTVRTMLSIQAVPDISAIRTAELFDQEHTVIPCICLAEGVLWPANAPHPELALAEEFGRFPEGWNGRPIVLNHPKVDGSPVAANTPSVLEDNSFGQMFNTKLVGNKLHTEIWINNARVEELGGDFQDAIDRLKDGDEVVEVSTGLFVVQEMVEGEFDGETYNAIWRNVVPDHLAILPEGLVGACSVEDGCGAPRLNEGHTMTPVMNSAVLRDLDKEALIIECDCGGTCDKCRNNVEVQEGLFKRVLGAVGSIFNFRGSLEMSAATEFSTNEQLGDGDIRMALNAALNEVENDRFFFILTVFQSNGAGEVVYEVGFDGTLFRRTFNIVSDTGAVEISEERTAVRPVTQFVPVEVSTNEDNVHNAQQETEMKREELVKALIANEGTQYTEDDSEWLLTLEDAQLEKMSPAIVADDETPADDEDTPTPPDVDADVDVDRSIAAVTAEQYVAQAPKEMQAVLQSGLSMHRGRKDVLVKGILANTRNTFSEKALREKELVELESIIALTGDVSYEFNGPTPTVLNDGDEPQNFTEAPSVWPAETETTH